MGAAATDIEEDHRDPGKLRCNVSSDLFPRACRTAIGTGFGTAKRPEAIGGQAIHSIEPILGSQTMGNRHIQAYKPANPARAHAPMPGWDRGDDKGPSAARTNGNRVIAQRVGQLYADASVAMRRRLLESLLRPLSIYALITVANGLFARIKAGNAEWQGFRLREEDIGEVDAQDVVELVELALQENNDAALDLSIAIGSVSESAHANELVQRMHDLAQRIAAAF